MKSPKKYSWFAFIIFSIGGIFIAAIEYLKILPPDMNGPLVGYGGPLLSFLVCSGIGLFLSLKTYSIYNKEVKNPVNPDNLVINNTYWLNGETPAKYTGMLPKVGKYVFKIETVNYFADPLDLTYLSQYQVITYISITKESS